jgi:hypothetical protein
MGVQFNTTVSAVAVIDSRGLTIYHNVFAAIPLPFKSFSGIAIQQFTLGDKQPGKFETWQEITSLNANV